MSTGATVIRGTNWLQQCDSEGPHRAAQLTYDEYTGTTVVWTPTHRTQGSWDNLFCYNKQTVTERAIRFAQNVDFTLQDQRSLDSLNCLEFQIECVLSQQKYNMAWQLKKTVGDIVLSTFDFGPGRWVDTGLRRPLSDFTPGKRSSFVSMVDMALQVIPSGPHHSGIYCNGDFLPVDITRKAVSTTQSDYTSFAFQLDGSNKEEQIAAVIDVWVAKF